MCSRLHSTPTVPTWLHVDVDACMGECLDGSTNRGQDQGTKIACASKIGFGLPYGDITFANSEKNRARWRKLYVLSSESRSLAERGDAIILGTRYSNPGNKVVAQSRRVIFFSLSIQVLY